MSVKKSTRSLLVKIFGSVLILALLFYLIDIDLNTILDTFKALKQKYFLFSLFGVVIVLLIKSFRWHKIILNEGYYYSPRKSFGAYMSSYTIGVITPGRLGEIARLYYLRESCEIGFLPSFRTIIIDRIFDLGVLVMLGIAGLLYYSKWVIFDNAYIAVGSGILLFFIGIYVVYFLLKHVLKKENFKNNKLFLFIYECICQSVDKRAPKLWFITVLAYLAYYAAIWLIFISLGIKMRIVDIAIVLSVVGLVTILPISWAGFGTREVSLVYLLSFYNISTEVALSFSLLQFTAFFFWGGVVGLIFWFLMPISLNQIKHDAGSVKEMLKKHSKEH